MRNKYLYSILFLFVSLTIQAQNVGIDTETPDAKLDVVSSNSGILVPRIALTAANLMAPVVGATNSELIYNTATVPGPNAVSPGFYYWSGSAWTPLLAGPFADDDWTRDPTNGDLSPTTITDKVGIGTDAPSQLLHVLDGEIYIEGTMVPAVQPTLRFNETGNIISNTGVDIILDEDNNSTNSNFIVKHDGEANILFDISENGRAAIGKGISENNVLLDLNSTTDMGLLIPNLDIANLGTALPVTITPIPDGMLAWNTNGTTGPNLVYWSAPETEWKVVTVAEDEDVDWLQLDDSKPTSINDNIYTDGYVGIGTNTPDPDFGLTIQEPGEPNDLVKLGGENFGIHATMDAQAEDVITADHTSIGSSSSFHAVEGILSGKGNVIGRLAYFRDNVTNGDRSYGLFSENGDYGGYFENAVGIGELYPAQMLHVVGTARISALAGVNSRLVLADPNGDLSTTVNGANGQVLYMNGAGIDWADPNTLITDDNDWLYNGLDLYNANSGNVGIGTNIPTHDLDVVGDIGLSGYLYHNDDDHTHVHFLGDEIRLQAGGREFIRMNPSIGTGEIAINESSTQTDFRVEGGTDANLLFTDGSADLVGIGINTPLDKLDVNGAVRVRGTGLKNASGYEILQTNANDWLRIAQGAEWTTGIAVYEGAAFNGGGITTGEWTIQPNGVIKATDYGLFLGGLHVGGTSDPGTDNLLVDGSGTISTLGGVGNAVVLTNNTGLLSRIALSGSSNDVLLGDGTFGPGTAFGDNLGNHSATTTLDMNSNIITEVNILSTLAESDYDKLRVYSTSDYTIGMHSAMSFGYLNDWATTFTMNNETDRGWVWRDAADAQSDGGMSLTTDGKLYVKSTIGINNGGIFQAKNSAGSLETFLWPRWTDNITYMNYGSAGFHIRNNASATAMFMTNSGDIGIGLTNPAYPVHIYRAGATYTSVSLSNGTTGNTSSDGVCYGLTTDGWGQIWNRENTGFRVGTNATERMRIDEIGRMGINTAGPTHRLHIISPDAETVRLEGPGSFGSGSRLNFGDSDFVYVGEDVDDQLNLKGLNMAIEVGGTFGANGYVLSSNGATVSWTDPNSLVGGGDNLGNHSATTTLDMNNHAIIEAGRFEPYGIGTSSGQGAHSYAIFQETGGWSAPYPDLRIAYHTGIKLGAHYSYNGIRFYNNSDMVTQTFSVNDGDNNARFYYDLRDGSNNRVVIDDNGGWHRSYGNTGWYNGTYGGGWYMTDGTWIRNYNSKPLYIYGNGNVSASFANGKVGVNTTAPSFLLHSVGAASAGVTIMESNNSSATGVALGALNSSTGNNGYAAMEANNDGADGNGVFGRHRGTGFGIGVYGVTLSGSGWAGYFNADVNLGLSTADLHRWQGVIRAGSVSDAHQIIPDAGNWSYVGNSSNYFYYMYATTYANPSARELKRDIHPVNDGLYETVMSDIDRLVPSFYKYNLETDLMEVGNEAKFRPNMHLGVILDEAPDYIQDNAFSGIDIYALATLGIAGVKYNRQEIQDIKDHLTVKTISDFGSITSQNNEVWIEFSKEFIEQLNGKLPVVTVTPIGQTDSPIFISEKSKNGFRLATNADQGFTVDWMAMAKVETPNDTDADPGYKSNGLISGLRVPSSEKQLLQNYFKSQSKSQQDLIDSRREAVKRINTSANAPTYGIGE